MAGSITSVWIDNVHYNTKSDSDFNATGDVETEGIRHSGGTLPKRTTKVATVEGCDLIVDGAEELILRAVAKKKPAYKLQYTDEEGIIKDADGWINIEGVSSMERTMSIIFIPDGEWTITPA